MTNESVTRTAVAVEKPELLVAPPAVKGGDERRRAPRAAARLLVRCPRPDQPSEARQSEASNRRRSPREAEAYAPLDGYTRDVSVSGTFIETPSRPAIGSQHEITIAVSEEVIPAMVLVTRHAPDGVGLTFMRPSSPLKDVLTRLTDEVVV